MIGVVIAEYDNACTYSYTLYHTIYTIYYYTIRRYNECNEMTVWKPCLVHTYSMYIYYIIYDYYYYCYCY